MNHQPGSDQGATRPFNTVQCPSCGLRVSRMLAKCPQDGTTLGSGPTDAFTERYEFLEAMGTGGMSVIYKARQRALNRIVAIKMMHEHMMTGPAIRRFQQEGKSASSLDHPNIVKVHDFGLTDAGQPYMVMDLVEGKSLSQVLEELGELPIPQALIVFIDICDALSHAHEKGILHRDLKPSNIMLTTTSERAMMAKLVDFGIAKLMDEDADSPMQKLTQTGELFGSPLYMSPEQCYGRKVDRRSDIYSFGCLMFECLTGQLPLSGDTLVDTITKQMTAKPPLLSEVRPDKRFPRRLEDVVDKCLAKNPDSRYRRVDDLRAQLVSIQQEVDEGLQKEKSAFSRFLRTASSWKLTALMVVAGCLIAWSLGAGISALRNSHVSEQKKLVMEKSKFLPLMVRGNITTPIVAECLSENVGLEKLDLSRTKINDDALLYVDQQTGLKELYLANTEIGDKGLSSLKHIPHLQKLDLTGTQVSSDGLKSLSGMPELKTLVLKNTRIDASGIKYLAVLKKLEELSLSKNKRLTGPCLTPLAQLHLKALHLSDTGLQTSDFESIKDLKKLQTLSLNETNLAPAVIQDLEQLPALTTLQIRDSKFDDSCAKDLANLKQLRHLDISGTKITSSGLADIVKSPNLVELDLRRLPIDSKSIAILQNLKHLQKLDLSNIDGLDDAVIAEIAKINSITKLYIPLDKGSNWKNKITPKIGGILATQMPQLTELSLASRRWPHITDVPCLEQIAKLKNLRLLDLTDVEFDHLNENSKALHVNLPHCLIKTDIPPNMQPPSDEPDPELLENGLDLSS